MITLPSAEQNMLQDHDLLYFLHIPKTAGGTLINILDNWFDKSEIFEPMLLSDLLNTPDLFQTMARSRLFHGHFEYAMLSLIERPLHVITILRDPVERTLSQFEHSRRHPEVNYWNGPGMVGQKTTLAEFLTIPEARRCITNVQTRCFVSEWQGLGQLDLWDTAPPVAPDTFLLNLAKRRLQQCQVIGIQERFDDSLRLICYTLGFRMPREFRNEHVLGRSVSKNHLDAVEVESLREINQLDQALYDYGRQVFDERFAAMDACLEAAYPDTADLDARLDAHYWQTHPAPELTSEGWRYEFSQPLIGTNWYLREALPQGGYYRWMGPGAFSTLECGVECEGAAVIEIGILGAISVDVFDSLQVHINDYPVDLTRKHGLSSLILQGQIPASAFRPHFQVLHFQVSETRTVKSVFPDSPDERHLGVSLHYIEFHLAAEH